MQLLANFESVNSVDHFVAILHQLIKTNSQF